MSAFTGTRRRPRAWFDCYLRGSGCDAAQTSVSLVPENFKGQVPQTAALPRTRSSTFVFPGVTTFGRPGKVVRRSQPLSRAVEVFGSPTLKVTIAASGGWSRLVAVISARTPGGKEIVVSAGGVPTRNGLRTVVIRLLDQATYIPRGSRLTLTLGSSSLAQSSTNLLYLDLPLPAGAKVRIGNAVLSVPGLRTPVTR
jgi:hypothetical protein